MKKGFTLAEVLITLAVIGVVAALTIPTVVHKYQQKQYYTAFMKTFNTLSTALQLFQNEGKIENKYSFINLPQYLRVASSCTAATPQDCGLTEEYAQRVTGVMPEDTYINVLQDGSIIVVFGVPDPEGIYIYADTNGSKGPNKSGRDFFTFAGVKVNDMYKILPQGMYDNEYDSEKNEYTFTLKPSEDIIASCHELSGNFVDCGGRLLIEGKMDY